MRLVVVRWRHHPDGSWSAAVICHGRRWVNASAPTAHELVALVGVRLEHLAGFWRCGVRAVHDLEGDVRAFAVVAHVEGFDQQVRQHVAPRVAAHGPAAPTASSPTDTPCALVTADVDDHGRTRTHAAAPANQRNRRSGPAG
jgi:hypothetical protein